MNTSLTKKLLMLVAILVILVSAAACATVGGADEPAVTEDTLAKAFIEGPKIELVNIEAELIPLFDKPALSTVLMPEATGTLVKSNSSAVIDYSNTADGYVMIKFIKSTDKKIKVQVKGPSSVTYTYNLKADSTYETFPLSDGSGSYTVTVYENVSGNSYSTAATLTTDVKLKDEFAPFILPNQYVNYSADSKTVAKAAELVGQETDALKKVELIYTYIVTNFSYDYDLASSVKSGYIPVLDNVLAAKKGICFDYAALMTAMLRSQGVPTKLVVGYSGTAYHAWISTYVDGTGWVNGAVYFDGTTWKLMDPTYASSAKQSASIMEYIGNGANYSAKYLY